MGKQETIKTEVFQAAINFVREHHPEAIDAAYKYYWDDQQPDEFMQGMALELGFMNFEDWLIFDYKANEEKETFLTIYSKCDPCLGDEGKAVIEAIQDSFLSFYEVLSVSEDKRVRLKDLLCGGEFLLGDKNLTRGLNVGDIFATRLLFLDDNYVIGGCVYPYSAEQKQQILRYIDVQFGRYKRNVRQDGTMENYLKDYGDVFNIIWMNYFLDPSANEV
ncbi:MAG: hypothetical protein ACYC69_08755 [Thermodesulfovibrionales bacterium]